MRLHIDIVNSEKDVLKIVLDNACKIIDAAISKAIPNIEKEVKRRIAGSIRVQPEYSSIINGQLMGELGLIDGQNRLERIINIWVDSLVVKKRVTRRSGDKITGGFRIEAINADYSDVISREEAVLITEKGTNLFWLQWLLTEGDKKIILDYKIVRNPRRSRTNTVIMKGDSTTSWGIPAEFAGTINNNFVTRAMNSIIPEMEELMEIEIEKQL